MCGASLWLLTLPALAQEPSRADAGPAPAIDPASLATPARIEALQTLSAGVHPGVPLDSLLNVSLDDDSSMNERDKAVRLERRKILIASRVAERFKNRTPEELQQMRDQVLAMDLERKVLALPIEVRSRLIDEDAERGASPRAAASPSAGQPVDDRTDVTPAAPEPAARPSAERAPSQSAPRAAEPAARAGAPRSLAASLAILLGFLAAVWVAARLFRSGVANLAQRAPAPRASLTALAHVGSLILGVIGVVVAPLVAFADGQEAALAACGWLALVLLAVGGRDLAASAVAGCVLALKRPFRVGDRIEVAGLEGKVSQLGLSATQLITSHDRLVTLPNRALLNAPLAVLRAQSALTQLELDFYVDANQDAGAAKRIFGEVLTSTRGADLPKGHGILVKQLLRDSGTIVRLRARVFVNATKAEEIESELTERVLEALRTGGIRAPSQLPTAPRVREPTEPFAFG